VTVDLIVLAGAAGGGKSVTAYEISAQLRRAGVAHAVIDTDALDDVFPVPPELWRLSERNLACIWRGYRELAVERAVLAGVYLHRPAELAWVRRATEAERVTIVRLTAPMSVLEERVRRREIGSGYEAQRRRTAHQVRELDAEVAVAGVHLLATGGRPLPAIAAEVIELAGWQ
jgi:hypothetical protein